MGTAVEAPGPTAKKAIVLKKTKRKSKGVKDCEMVGKKKKGPLNGGRFELGSSRALRGREKYGKKTRTLSS